jgi:hypothetical protein
MLMSVSTTHDQRSTITFLASGPTVGYVNPVLLPLLLIALATGAAGIIAYGTDPAVAHWSHGLAMMMLSRRLQWPLVTLCLLLCIALLALVISGKRRAWWLIALAPILALFFHQFAPWNNQRLYITEFVAADQPTLRDDDWVVGLEFGDQAYALPYRALYSMPIVFLTDYDKRAIVMWSAQANRASAWTISRELKPRDLEIVSTPLDTLLLFDKRLGQFIVAITGQTPSGLKPIGFEQPIPTIKTTWPVWVKLHPATKVLTGYDFADAPPAPVLPGDAEVNVDGVAAGTPIAVVTTSVPAAIQENTITRRPANLIAGQSSLLVFRDASNQLHAFDRNAKEDLFLTFVPKTSRKVKDAVMIDSDTNSWWTIGGKAIEGPLKGTQLKELPVESDLYWGVAKRWHPQLTMANPLKAAS